MEPPNQPTHLPAAHLCQRQPGAGGPDRLLQPPQVQLQQLAPGPPRRPTGRRAGLAAATGRQAAMSRAEASAPSPQVARSLVSGLLGRQQGGRAARGCGEGAVRISCQMNSGGRDARGESLLMRGSRGGARARQLTCCRPLRRRLPSHGEPSSHCVLLNGASGKGRVRIVSMRSARCASVAAETCGGA